MERDKVYRAVSYVEVDLVLAQKMRDGNETAADLVSAVLAGQGGSAGIWWGTMGPDSDRDYYEDEYDLSEHAQMESDPDSTVAGALAAYDETGMFGGVSVGVVLVAGIPMVNGAPFDPSGQDRYSPVDGNSYLPAGTALTIQEVWWWDRDGYNADRWRKLRAGGITVTADFPKTQKCEYCKDQATQRIIHSEGMAYIPVCDSHLGEGKDDAAACVPYGDPDPSNIVRVDKISRYFTEEELRAIARDGVDAHPETVEALGKALEAVGILPPGERTANVIEDLLRADPPSSSVPFARHSYAPDPASGAGNCWCGASDRDSIHRTASDLDDILDLLGPSVGPGDPYVAPENTHPGIDGVPRGWELYVEDMLAAPDRNASADLWMPTSAVAHYAEYARDGEQLEAVMYAIQQRGGIWSPVDISTDGRLALLHEGNHRLAAAQRLGIAEIPVRVSVDPVVRANEGTPVPLEPVLEGWLRQTGRIARTAAEPGGVLPYAPSDFGYRWDRIDPETYAAVTRDGISEMTLWFGAPGSVQWTVEDDLGIVERGYISGADPDQIFDRANRLISEFDTNPAIPAKTDGYDPNYTETHPSNFPAPNFMEPGVYR